MKNGNRQAFGIVGALILVVIFGATTAILGPRIFPTKKLDRDTALTIQTITGPEKVENNDILMNDEEKFKVELGTEKEAGFVFMKRVYSDGKREEITKSLSEFHSWGRCDMNEIRHLRLIRVGTPKYQELVGQF